MLEPFDFPAIERFVNRETDLARLEEWWNGDDPNALALFGRRRVGKSWLFRRLAHGKPAIVLVAERRDTRPQLQRLAERLSPALGFRPDIPDLSSLFEVLYRLAADERRLVVIDEFPWLLPSGGAAQREALTSIQAVMEERDASQLRLVLCGSYIGQMESLLSESSPLRGRLTPLRIRPLRFDGARRFMPDALDVREQVERYAVAGGMAMYLDELARGESLAAQVQRAVLSDRGKLFDDPREVLEEELRAPGVYFSLLEELAFRRRSLGELAAALNRDSGTLGPYLNRLSEMEIIRGISQVVGGSERDRRWECQDPFLRFWFRFVFGMQDDLGAGLEPADYWDGAIAPELADHAAPVFEDLCREWVRKTHGRVAPRVGSWWGPARHDLRRTHERETDEIDIVGVARNQVTLIGECKWTAKPLDGGVLRDLDDYKLPALRQSKAKVAKQPRILLFSRSGFERRLVEDAAERGDVELVDATQVCEDLASD
ncbi:ATP-binding protein [Solirubrobacter sp. CPCC 204708]|uniref:ATP-binding protein n=1 Tax=Solirubrobacter deserti TaxID=2282478 RepID=A0ABT4RL64_9ACTN|nr:ATP-binding protein [Solirubrobacter deserti]MBE2318982.1 ATP-binding protein [Solirubrobacter deserti]MDA0139293.1 ATP-binding protein [Solirubrobacter deserti]